MYEAALQPFLPDKPGTCPNSLSTGNGHLETPGNQGQRSGWQRIRQRIWQWIQKNSLSTGNGHLETPGNQGPRSGWQRIWHWIQKKRWLIMAALIAIGITMALVFLILPATKTGDPGNNPDNQEKGSTDMGGALIWQNCNGTKLNISTEEAPWEDANTNCAMNGGQLLAKSSTKNISGCINMDEDFWIQQEGPHPNGCEPYNPKRQNLSLKCDTWRRYICGLKQKS
ncbi:uncharacterized protein LOC101734820 isoform X2 [Xenopus tropicalis]|uniref:Uncharacterized protein LOC101734820 isoform X2 n=1 Tax=Xenopus tropicalis TaxID=8364 RepID=A0A8J1JPK9_XENTR|nr:uncharacterized protein LOC101734820 isoform X2 [Xenopus tropicalis]